MSFWDDVKGFVGDHGDKLLGGAGLLGAYRYQQNQLEGLGEKAYEGAQGVADETFNKSTFKPFTVSTGTGGSIGTNAQGGMNINLAPQEQEAFNRMFNQGRMAMDAAGNFDVQGRTGTIYDQMRQAQMPEEQRQRLALENRQLAQGRAGLSMDAYGGSSPEQLAMAKAIEEQKANAYLGARQAALGEQQQQYNLGSSMFQQAYLPQAQALNVLGQGLNLKQLQQQAQTNAANQWGTGQMTGLDALLQSGLGASNLSGNYLGALAGLIGNQYTTDVGAQGNAEANRSGFLSDLLGLGMSGGKAGYDWLSNNWNEWFGEDTSAPIWGDSHDGDMG